MKVIYDKYRNFRSKLIIFFYKIIYRNKLIIGRNFYVRKCFTVLIEEGGIVTIGDGCFFNNHSSINALKKVNIGNYCIFGENVHIYDHNHKYSNKNQPINDQGFTYGEVKIGHNCWIGSNVTILKGVTIGENSVIGAGCVIYKDIPPNSIVICKQELLIR